MSHDDSERDWRFGRGFNMNFDPGKFGFARSFRRHGGMKYYVLWLLSQRPMKGSEIIDEVQKQTMGWWRPSPGTVYPLLSALEQAELIHRLENLKYELTSKGAEEIGLKPGDIGGKEEESWNVSKIISEMEGYLSYLEEEPAGLGEFGDKIESIIERLKKLRVE